MISCEIEVIRLFWVFSNVELGLDFRAWPMINPIDWKIESLNVLSILRVILINRLEKLGLVVYPALS